MVIMLVLQFSNFVRNLPVQMASYAVLICGDTLLKVQTLSSTVIEHLSIAQTFALSKHSFVALPALWCEYIAIGCSSKRELLFKPDAFFSQPHVSTVEISPGNSFFDCMNDLQHIRSQLQNVSRYALHDSIICNILLHNLRAEHISDWIP